MQILLISVVLMLMAALTILLGAVTYIVLCITQADKTTISFSKHKIHETETNVSREHFLMNLLKGAV